MRVLGIESSCDETAAAVVDDGRRVLSSAVDSQIAQHRPYGGVVPEIASRGHVESFPRVVREAMDRAGVPWKSLDAIAVTTGPGLASSLIVGTAGARALGQALGKPVWSVNHIEAHIAAVFLDPEMPPPDEASDMLILMVSGGHTCLFRMRGIGRYRLLGTTLDDAAGECLDKGSKMLGLGYPGGPAIEKAAQGGDRHFADFPRGMEHAKEEKSPEGLDMGMCFSFSGLKTSLLYRLKNHPEERETHLADLAASYEEAVVSSLARRVERAVEATGAGRLLCAGGVAKNASLRARLAAMGEKRGFTVRLAPMAYCTDNAAMVAAAAGLRELAGIGNPPAGEIDPTRELKPDDFDA
jgi:N6-L-threonylcarbamoyladenine synthase